MVKYGIPQDKMMSSVKNRTKPTQFRIIIQHDNQLYHPANISLNTSGGDIYYLPSKSIELGKKTLHHVSFHRDGQTHAKDKWKRVGKHKGPTLLPIESIENQSLVVDSIGNFNNVGIPTVSSRLKTDLVLDLPGGIPASVDINISIIPEHLKTDQITRRIQVEGNYLTAISQKIIRHKFGNVDKLLQVSLYPLNAPPEGTGFRRMTMSDNSEITKIGQPVCIDRLAKN